MNVRKFTANTSREALRMLRDALGADAVILSNKTVNGKVEIMAMAEESVPEYAPVEKPRSMAPEVARLTPAFPAESARSFSPRSFAPEPEAEAVRPLITRPSVASPVSSANAVASSELHDVMSEIRSMRSMLESQLAELSWSATQQKQPHKAEVLREMLATGLSASLSRYLISKLPEGDSVQNGVEWVKSVLARNLMTIDNESEILEKGGVYALVGPTGVGKTTTTAKLAARCVMRHGPSQLALITTDGYRIGGYEQLRIYGKILGVMVHAVKDESDLRIALSELKNKHTVLIDTVGVSQRDKMVTEQVAMLSGSGSQVKRLLCLNATSTGETLSEVVRAYQGGGLAGCILTKLDEAATIGGALDIAIRQRLALYYVASGQRVPEDLHVANKQYLIDRAFKLKRETAAFRYLDEELPLIMAGAVQGRSAAGMAKEVSLG
ncbi:flagellar biosynthesis protein FlhF [Undibacterium crateris]|jgi:flagellar biosynthesis protein FlhF|uniref:flagellar biosynthesis protein FlhF n=1 Tax=Undibacterium crateris TaxID=2528175 RepID=UPI00138A5AE2|nr:flagellar biosynthesis protein FlhF [Undibacterium crateris]NDI86795.1 flagellar biosynthesis protein FlhF [Undibacterium crateris]